MQPSTRPISALSADSSMLRSLFQRIRRRGYHRRYERGYAEALVAYESVFEEILADLHPTPSPVQGLGIDFGWICDPASYRAEALARSWLRERQVRLSVRWFTDFQGITNAIFRSRDLFPALGDATGDPLSFAELLGGGDDGEGPDTSSDPLRQEASCVTVELALAMIALHEIGHHALGHLDAGPSRLRMLSETPARMEHRAPANILWRQACEIEADRFGFSRVLACAAAGRSPFPKQLVSATLAPHLFDLAILAYLLVIALLHTGNESLERYADADHPHPAVRLLASQVGFAEFLAQHPAARDRYRDGWRESLRVLAHDPEQTQTLRLLVHELPRVEAKLVPLNETVRRTLRPAARTYDFSTGRWQPPAGPGEEPSAGFLS